MPYEPIFFNCPICGRALDGLVIAHYCPEGHYRYTMVNRHSQGYAAAIVRITLEGRTEEFFLDDERLDDTEKFLGRLKIIQAKRRPNWLKDGF